MKKLLSATIFCFVFFQIAQAQIQQRLKIAIYTPLYLDSAMDAVGNLRTPKNFPKYVNGGLDFYLGAQAALDSLQKRNAPLEVFIYDLKARNALAKARTVPVNLIIGHTDVTETRSLAATALAQKTPFISATIPNDAGVSHNPYFVQLNSTFGAHLQALYKFLQQTYGREKITVFTKAGAQEDLVKRMLLSHAGENGLPPASLQFVTLPSNFTTAHLERQMDSTQKNIVLAGSLQESFGLRLVNQLSELNKKYNIAVVGMPTWENFSFGKISPNLEVIYSTPFFYDRDKELVSRLYEEYLEKTGSRPSDFFFRGYETTLRFALLLLDTHGDLAGALSRDGNTVFTNFDIRPISKANQAGVVDYYENKHLYFVRLMNGEKHVYAW